MDNTIVATAMGKIISDLGGLDKFVWVTSAYMVAVMAGMPIFGKLSDMYGRKRFLFWVNRILTWIRIVWFSTKHCAAKYLPSDSRNWRRSASSDCFYHRI